MVEHIIDKVIFSYIKIIFTLRRYTKEVHLEVIEYIHTLIEQWFHMLYILFVFGRTLVIGVGDARHLNLFQQLRVYVICHCVLVLLHDDAFYPYTYSKATWPSPDGVWSCRDGHPAGLNLADNHCCACSFICSCRPDAIRRLWEYSNACSTSCRRRRWWDRACPACLRWLPRRQG